MAQCCTQCARTQVRQTSAEGVGSGTQSTLGESASRSVAPGGDRATLFLKARPEGVIVPQPRARGRLPHCGPRTRHIDACCGGRRCSTIWCLVYSPVVFQVLVLQTRVSIQSGRSCFSICREPQLDAGHPLASQQRWCDESYHPAICVAYQNASAHGPKHGLCQVIWGIPPGEAAPSSPLFTAPVDTLSAASEGALHDHQ